MFCVYDLSLAVSSDSVIKYECFFVVFNSISGRKICLIGSFFSAFLTFMTAVIQCGECVCLNVMFKLRFSLFFRHTETSKCK